MGGNGVNFNAPKDTTGVNRVNTQNILRAAGQGALKGGINCIFTHGKDSTGNVGGKVDSYAGKITHTDYENGQPVGQNGEDAKTQGEKQEDSGLTATVGRMYDANYDYKADPNVITGEAPYVTELEGHIATDYKNGQPVGQNGEEVEPQGENQEESWLTGTVNHWYGPDYDYRKDPFVISGENPYPRHLEANLDTGEIKVVYDNDEYNNK